MTDRGGRPLEIFTAKDEDWPTGEVDFEGWCTRKTARKTQPAAGLVARDLERRRVAQELRDDVQEAKRQLGM
jgi:hypothetical protein